jgi:hypothetical protein
MSSSAIRKRQMQLLTRLANLSKGRTDSMVAIEELAPTLKLIHYRGGLKFVDKADPKYEGGSELAYDYNSLKEEDLIRIDYLTHKRDSYGGAVYEDPAVKVTAKGFETVEDAEKWWIQKAIEKEPITFLQIVITILAGIGGWAVGRYLTPAESPRGGVEYRDAGGSSGEVKRLPRPASAEVM